ncbi:hypothetical protein AM228_18900 [Planktothricoides sp. SR001]|nr:hypothetical protein AM228_18900 [Planktothricoides sp. SR001]
MGNYPKNQATRFLKKPGFFEERFFRDIPRGLEYPGVLESKLLLITNYLSILIDKFGNLLISVVCEGMVSGRMTDGDSLALRKGNGVDTPVKLPIAVWPMQDFTCKKRSYLWIYRGFPLNQSPV